MVLHQTKTNSVDFSWKDFVETIYKRDPEPPYTFSMEALEDMPQNGLQQYLTNFIIYGAKKIYNKELARLDQKEINNLQRYLRSIGWDVNYKVETRLQKLNDGLERDKETQVNYFLIDFTPAKHDELNGQNKPDRFAA